MPDYGYPGRLAAALDRAIARDNAVPRPAPTPLCGQGGCALPAGHVERVGSAHQTLEESS